MQVQTTRSRRNHRAALLEGAIACLQHHGYARTTAREIAAASDASLGSIGYHYGSTQQLLDEALIESFRRWLAPIIDAGASRTSEPVGQQLSDALEQFLSSLPERRPLVAAFFEAIAQAERNEQLKARMAALYHDCRQAVGANVNAALPDASDRQTHAAASLIMATFDGLLLQWLLDEHALPPLHELARGANLISDATTTPT